MGYRPEIFRCLISNFDKEHNEKAFDVVSLYSLFGIMIPIACICINFIMIRFKMTNMRQTIRTNFSNEESNKSVVQAFSRGVMKTEIAVTRSIKIVIYTSLILRLVSVILKLMVIATNSRKEPP